ncbi:helix-turn-helix transcriptional regulator [Bacillus aquiflavi]|uniref:Helix-turn-helix transcriptional regulator n=1 Tax=Bacillus aquiflavi TaxID=2672567 RepID=A0A6B3VWJ9_9BACI|nr:helix-turn-helix transcriptional regulator [Bacillus aquiflavi]MBA4538119.1 helix-turn-helix transcriptional regulator [Bacillus aquiflavi]NEY82439.1 helix-turn-helix transcriptional regulator [Bacillus aquiflavi]
MRVWMKKIRMNKSLTQEDIAEQCKISRSYYTHIENGTKTPTVPVAKRMANFFDCEWTIFFENERSLEDRNKKNTQKVV